MTFGIAYPTLDAMHRVVGARVGLAWILFVLLLPGCPSVGARRSCDAVDGGHTDGEVPVDPLCPGACDDDAARAVVYDAAGRAMYAGQAIMVESCAGGGNFCHSSTARDRYGVPASLDFDVFPLRTAAMAFDEDGLRSLVRTQATVHRNRNGIWSTVVGGTMPPGAVGDPGTGILRHNFGWVTDPTDVSTDQLLATLETLEGREILRNWLACGSPIIERWTPYTPPSCDTNRDCATACTAGECEPAGDVIPRIDRPLEPNWRSIYLQVIEPSCTTPGCHAPDPLNDDAVSAGLDLSDEAMGRAALVGVAASTAEPLGAVCGGTGRMRVVAGDPDASLLIDKLENDPPACGDQMPFGQPLDTAQIDAIRMWIMAGAMP